MMYRFLFFAALIIGTTVLLTSCFKEPTFDDVPFIAFKTTEYKKGAAGVKDSIIVSISFQDGDGDLGLNPNETNPPFDQNGTDYFNYLADLYYETSPDHFEKYPFNSNLPNFYGRFPRLTPKSSDPDKPRPLEGTLIYGYETSPGLNLLLGNKRIKFFIKMKDRALHQSNEIQTDPILVPPL